MINLFELKTISFDDDALINVALSTILSSIPFFVILKTIYIIIYMNQLIITGFFRGNVKNSDICLDSLDRENNTKVDKIQINSWLRRFTRNQLGSNPVGEEFHDIFPYLI